MESCATPLRAPSTIYPGIPSGVLRFFQKHRFGIPQEVPSQILQGIPLGISQEVPSLFFLKIHLKLLQ